MYVVEGYHAVHKTHLTDSPRRSENFASGQLIIASRAFRVRPNRDVEFCLVLTNAETSEVNGLEGTLFISSGNLMVETNRGFSESVVLCRGDITYGMGFPETSIIRAGGTLTDTGVMGAGKRDPLRFEKEKNLYGEKFYSCADDGLEVKFAGGRVEVVGVDDKKPFALAGLKKGDEVTRVNGERITSLQDFDRMVCRAVVSTGVATLKVRRGESVQTVEVKLAEW